MVVTVLLVVSHGRIESQRTSIVQLNHGEVLELNLSVDDGGVAIKGCLRSDVALDVVAFATDGHVFISSSEEALVFFIGGTEGETGALFAQLADGGQLLDFLALGDEL